MLSSIMMFGASFKSKKVYQIIFMVLWVILLAINTNLSYGWQFPLLNLFVGIFTMLIAAKLSQKHEWASIFTILLYSLLIDTASFLLFPEWTMGVNYLNYIWNGILFNYKTILMPLALFTLLKLSQLTYKKLTTVKQA